MDNEKYKWVKTISIGFILSSIGIAIAILGALFYR